MIEQLIFKDGKKRVVTLSFDDGSCNDERLVPLLNKLGLKATFHLNGNNYVNLSGEEIKKYRELYKNHEISCHTFSHCWPSRMQPASLTYEILKDREVLERIAEYPVLGMSYPNGSYNDEVANTMKSCGIVYSRTTNDTHKFKFPDDFLMWHPTCHLRDAKDCIGRFNRLIDSKWTNPLLYIWGHSHELCSEDDWIEFEETYKTIAENDKIWYATNIEIYDYIKAQKSLKISADEKVFTNPSSIDLWVEKDGKDIIKIPSGETVKI